MNYKWLGITCGIVALGIVSILGHVILYGQELVIDHGNWEIAKLLVPAIVSVLGWLVTIWWALHQIEISTKKNRSLQQKLLETNEKLSAIDSTICAYKKMNEALRALNSALVRLDVNTKYMKDGKTSPSLVEIFNQSNEAFDRIFCLMEELKFDLARLKLFDINTKRHLELFDNINNQFNGSAEWKAYQESAAKFLMDESSDPEILYKCIESILENSKELNHEIIVTAVSTTLDASKYKNLEE